MFKKWRFSKPYSGLIKQTDLNLVRVNTGSDTVMFDVESKKIIKPEGYLGGISKDKAAPPKYYVQPLSGGSSDS